MTLANITYKLPEDCVLTPQHVGYFNDNLQYLFVHILVYNKQFVTLYILFHYCTL